MMPIVLRFIEEHKDKLQGKVIEIGSYNVNGSVRDVIHVTLGVDMREGPGVDLVCPVEALDLPPESFDACVSTDTLEHVKDWRGFIRKTWDLVKPNGWLVMTMAHQRKGRHAYPDDYWRMTPENILMIYPEASVFELSKEGKKPSSLAWVVQKKGILGNLEFEPCPVP